MRVIQFTETLNDFNSDLVKIKVLPLGEVTTTKGDFVVDNTSINLILSTFKKRGLDIVVDYEHQSVTDKMAIASGWIKDLFVEDDALVGLVEWTEMAKEQIKNKQYKYLSPTVLIQNKRAVRLHSVALTNTPAIDNMYPLCLSDNLNLNIMAILNYLGLDENATTEDVLNAIKQLNIEDDDNNDDKIIATKDTPEVLALKEEIKQLKEEAELKEINEILDDALKEGRMIPAQREAFTTLALADKEAFKTVLKNQKIVSPIGTNYSNELAEVSLKEMKNEEFEEFIKNNIDYVGRRRKSLDEEENFLKELQKTRKGVSEL